MKGRREELKVSEVSAPHCQWKTPKVFFFFLIVDITFSLFACCSSNLTVRHYQWEATLCDVTAIIGRGQRFRCLVRTGQYCQWKAPHGHSLASGRLMAVAYRTMGIRRAREEEATKAISSFIRLLFFFCCCLLSSISLMFHPAWTINVEPIRGNWRQPFHINFRQIKSNGAPMGNETKQKTLGKSHHLNGIFQGTERHGKLF